MSLIKVRELYNCVYLQRYVKAAGNFYIIWSISIAILFISTYVQHLKFRKSKCIIRTIAVRPDSVISSNSFHVPESVDVPAL